VYEEYDDLNFIKLGTLRCPGNVMMEKSVPAKKVLCTKPEGTGDRRRADQS
jgi:hypothetical protein